MFLGSHLKKVKFIKNMLNLFQNICNYKEEFELIE